MHYSLFLMFLLTLSMISMIIGKNEHGHGAEGEKSKACKDKMPFCPHIIGLHKCDHHKEHFKDVCKKSCGFCKPKAPKQRKGE